MGWIDSFKDVVKVANRVVNLGDRLDALAQGVTRDSARKDQRIRELEDRVLRLEAAFDFGIKAGLIRLPADDAKRD